MAVLTEEQLTSRKRAGWKVKLTDYDLNYKSQWDTPWYFVREFYQNALDEHDEAGITTKPKLTMTAKGMVVQDEGRGLGAEALMMRPTKTGGEMRGQFGEGLKYGCLVAARLGYITHIESPTTVIEAHVTVQELGRYKGETLVFLYKEKPTKLTAGTRILVEGYTGDLYKDRFTTFLEKPIFSAKRTLGRFQRNEEIFGTPNGRLYARDIFVRHLDNSEYSYNLWDLPLNPDRVSELSYDTLRSDVGQLWTKIDNVDLIVKLLRAMTTQKSFESELNWNRLPDSQDKPLWVDAWYKLFGQKAVLWTDDLIGRLAEAYGYKTVGREWSSSTRYYLTYLMPTDDKVMEERREEISKPKPIPDSKLTQDQLVNLKVLRYLVDNCDKCLDEDGQKPKLIAADIPPEVRTGATILGLCAPGEAIYLSREVLNTEEDSLGTLFHEAGHWIGGSNAVDGTMSHTRAVENISAYMAILIRHRFGEIASMRGEEQVGQISHVTPKEPQKPIYPWQRTYTSEEMLIDQMYSGKQLVQMLRERGLQATGDKKEMAAQLLRSGFQVPMQTGGTFPSTRYNPGMMKINFK